MHDLPLITTIAAAFTSAWLMGLLTQRLGLSPIVGYLVAGVLIGPYTPGFVGDVQLANISRSRWRSLVSTTVRAWRESISKPSGAAARTAASTILFQLSIALRHPPDLSPTAHDAHLPSMRPSRR